MSTLAVELNDEARELLDRREPDLAFVWPRAAAVLGRQGLEASLAELWRAKAPGTEACSARAQLVCLRGYLDPELAGRVAFAYSALSRACHHHPYELAPSRAELSNWLDVCREFATRVDQITGADASG